MARLDDTNRKLVKKYDYHKTGNGYKLDLNFGNLGAKLDIAQRALDSQVWTDTQRYMPIDTGNLISQTNALNAVTSKKVYMFPPNLDYGHYQYAGILYVDPVYGYGGLYNEETGQWFSRKGVTKVPSGIKLKYSNPRATAEWGETAINNHARQWYDLVQRVVKG